MGFPGGSDGKESGCNAGEGNGYPLQYSCLENSMVRGYSPWGRKESDMTEQISLSLFTFSKKKGKETIEVIVYTSPKWILIQTWIMLGSPSLKAVWSPNWEGVLGCMLTPWVRLQIAVSVAPYNRKPQTAFINGLRAKILLWFLLYPFYNDVYFTLWVIGFL